MNGLPSCQVTPWRSGKVSSVPSSFHDQAVARSGTIESRLFCFTCWSNTTRLLNTPIGYSPIYPCHIKPRDMRQHPIGTGPFKFVEFKPNERITVTRNPDYWKAGRPYLDGIEYTIIRNQSTATLAFVAGKFDMTFLYSLEVPLLRDVKSQMPQAICELVPLGISRSLIVNRDVPPFDNPDLRQAMALSLDRAAFIN